MTGQQPNLFSAFASEIVLRFREQSQIITIDHADIGERRPQDSVRARFRQSAAIVPQG